MHPPGPLALSEHLLGLWPFSAPLLALGIPAPAVYNLLFIASAAASAFTTFLLVFHLTGSRSASLVAGLLFGFAPYRLGQAAHLQILAAWWGPLALLALHRQAERGGWRWAWVFAGSWLLLTLTSGYHLLFFTLVAGLTGAWLFVRRGGWRHAWPVVVATACAVLVHVPLLVGYVRAHDAQGLTRQPGEIDEYAADVTDLWRVPTRSRFWGSGVPGGPGEEERALFPGAALVAGVALALVVSIRRRPDGAAEMRGAAVSWRPALVCLALAAIPLSLSTWAALAPGEYHVAGVDFSLSRPAKPATFAFVLLTAAWWLSPHGQRVRRRRGALALYAGLGVATWLLTLGPRARFGEVVLLYHAPYAWLMALPGGLSMRVAPRFWLWTVLALAVVTGLAIAALRRHRPAAGAAAAVALGALAVLDGWPNGLPLAPLPPAPSPAARALLVGAPLVELPLGDPVRDMAAMWRRRSHGHPVVNGYSGHDPAHYRVLDAALDDGDLEVLTTLAAPAGLVVAVDAAWADVARRVGTLPGAVAAGTEAGWTLFTLPAIPPSTRPTARRVDPGRVSGGDAVDVTEAVVDEDPHTRWETGGPQRAGEALLVELPDYAEITAVELGQGREPTEYPRRLRVEAASGSGWQVVYDGRPAPAVLQAMLDDPLTPRVVIPLPSVRTRALRLVLADAHDRAAWSVSRIHVHVGPARH